MSFSCCSSLTRTLKLPVPTPNLKNNQTLTSYSHLNFPLRNSFHTTSFTCRVGLGFEDVAAIAQNKVLVAAAVSAAIGQFSKPFTSVILYGKTFNLKAVIQAGGFPSTHSSAVVATATSLGLERGFSDSIFGLTVVYAALVMYDAQGVRREVGRHARIINRILLEREMNYTPSKNTEEDMAVSPRKPSSMNAVRPCFSEEQSARSRDSMAAPHLLERYTQNTKIEQELKGSEKVPKSSSLLQESIGHTEIEVIAGALLGFFVSLTINYLI